MKVGEDEEIEEFLMEEAEEEADKHSIVQQLNAFDVTSLAISKISVQEQRKKHTIPT